MTALLSITRRGLYIFVLGYLWGRLLFLPGNVWDVVALADHVEASRAHNAALFARNAHLADEVVALERVPAAIEYQARMDLNMVKPGETLYLIAQ